MLQLTHLQGACLTNEVSLFPPQFLSVLSTEEKKKWRKIASGSGRFTVMALSHSKNAGGREKGKNCNRAALTPQDLYAPSSNNYDISHKI